MHRTVDSVFAQPADRPVESHHIQPSTSGILLRQALIIVGLIGSALALAQLLTLTLSSQIQNNTAALTVSTPTFYKPAVAKPAKVTYGLPARLKIPKIQVDAALENVGLTTQGALGVPRGLANAAWFDLGLRPGEVGDAVIDGHFSWNNSVPAVFNYLYKLHVGDNVLVEDENGTTTTFVVRELRTYDPQADTSDVFRSNDGLAHLNLITCDGVWDKVSKSYPKRLVVFTDKE